MTEQPIITLNDGVAMPQFGLGVFQTPPETTADSRAAGGRRRLSPDRHRLDVSQRTGRRRSAAGSPRRVRDDQTRQPGSRLRQTLRAFDQSESGSGASGSTSISSTGRGHASTSTSRPGMRWSTCSAKAGSARSASPTSTATTWSGSSARPASPPRSTRSSFIPASSSTPCAPSTTRWGSRRSRGARSDGPPFSPTR